MITQYKILKSQTFTSGVFTIVPIRMEDRYSILNWRNEQVEYLRQSKPLTREEQDKYFETVVQPLFEQQQPKQLLFSFLDNGQCVGYGGLVHIDWENFSAETSFLTSTKLVQVPKDYEILYGIFLRFIFGLAFNEIGLERLHSETFETRHYQIGLLETNHFVLEGRMRKRVKKDGQFYDALIHSVIRDDLKNKNIYHDNGK